MSVPLIAGNWKMNGLAADLVEVEALARMLRRRSPHQARVALCAPATLIERMARRLVGFDVLVGGEDCHAKCRGPHTGEISAEMLAEAGARLVLVGHSERRADQGETDAMVGAKAAAALRAGLEPVICVGETAAQRQRGLALEVVRRQIARSVPTSLPDADLQLARVTIAYEPVWAIGADQVPTLDEIEEAHAAIRDALIKHLGERGRGLNILYGGSVTPENAGRILSAAEVGGALVGRAAMKADDFFRVVEAADRVWQAGESAAATIGHSAPQTEAPHP